MWPVPPGAGVGSHSEELQRVYSFGCRSICEWIDVDVGISDFRHASQKWDKFSKGIPNDLEIFVSIVVHFHHLAHYCCIDPMNEWPHSCLDSASHD